MAKKVTLREKRRIEREKKQRRQRTIALSATAVVVLLIAVVALIYWNRQRNENAAATATTVAQMATNTVLAATQSVQQTSAAATLGPQQTQTALALATSSALAASVKPMTFTGVPTDTVKTTSGLQYKDIKVGTGAEAKEGSSATVHYTGWLANGTQFDSSVGKDPFSVSPLGQANVIKGWNEGLVGMKVGGTRILVIPPDLGYGAAGSGSTIPPNATLVFEIVLLSVK